MRCLEKLQPAVLHIWKVAPEQFEFESIAVMRAPKQYGLVLELHPQLSIFEYRLNHELRFRITILYCYVSWFATDFAISRQALALLPFTFRYQAVRTVEYGLCRAIILFQRDDLGRWPELLRAAQDIFNLGGPK